MKRIIIVILSIFLISCTQNKSHKNTKPSLSYNSIQDPNYEQKSKPKDYEKIGFELLQNESLDNLKIGLLKDDVIKLLGEPNEKTETEFKSTDCEYHQTYMYSTLGIKIDLIGKNETNKAINTITIKSPCEFQTKKGISIGSSIDQIFKAYKDSINPDFSDSTSIVVGSYFGGIIFKLYHERVISIYFGINAQ